MAVVTVLIIVPEHIPDFREYDVNGDGIKDLVVPFSQDASLGQRFDPSLMVYTWDSFVPESPNFGKKTPWVTSAHGPD